VFFEAGATTMKKGLVALGVIFVSFCLSAIVARAQVIPLSDLDSLRYIASHGDLIQAFGADAEKGRSHYDQYGLREGRKITFDPNRYMASHPDLILAFGGSEEKATRHYIEWGYREGRTTTGFDGLAYIASYGDLIAAFGTDSAKATRHYIDWGYKEGRRISFDPLAYIASYADLIAAFATDAIAGAKHYIEWGYKEGRRILFDALAYIARYADIQAAFGIDTVAATKHFILWGSKEGRIGEAVALNVVGMPSSVTSYQLIEIRVSTEAPGCRTTVSAVSDPKILYVRDLGDGQFSFRAPIVYKGSRTSVRIQTQGSDRCATSQTFDIAVASVERSQVPFLKLSPHRTDLDAALRSNYYSVLEYGMGYTYVAERISTTFCYPTVNDCVTQKDYIPGYIPAGMHAGDFNGDGHQDVVIAADVGDRPYEAQTNEKYTSKVLLLLNDGTGRLVEDKAFYDKDAVTNLQNPYRMVVADFNGDKVDDVFIGNFGNWFTNPDNTSGVEPGVQGLLLSSPQGMIDGSSRIFYPKAGKGFDRPSHDAGAGDFDGDGDVDITFAGYIIFNDGKGNFPTYLDLTPDPVNPIDASSVGDFNGDGIADIVLYFRHSNSPSGGAKQVGADGCYTSYDPSPIDARCAGFIALGPFSPSTLIGTGGKVFRKIANGIYGNNTYFNNTAVGDIDSDGDLDIVVGSTRIDRYYEGRKVQVLLNNGRGEFSDVTEVNYPAQRLGEKTIAPANNGIGEGDVFLKDFDGDGDLDIIDSIAGCPCNDYDDFPRVIVALNDGTGKFSVVPNDLFPNRLQLKYFTGYDGFTDSTWRTREDPLNSGVPPEHLDTAPPRIRRAVFVDLDGEGQLDLVSFFDDYHYRVKNNVDPEEKNFFTIYSLINTAPFR
jgi:FG-GAP-like repeat